MPRRDGSINVTKVVKELGETLMKGLADLASAHGLKVSITGPPAIPFMKFANETNFLRSQLFCGECAKRGRLLPPSPQLVPLRSPYDGGHQQDP